MREKKGEVMVSWWLKRRGLWSNSDIMKSEKVKAGQNLSEVRVLHASLVSKEENRNAKSLKYRGYVINFLGKILIYLGMLVIVAGVAMGVISVVSDMVSPIVAALFVMSGIILSGIGAVLEVVGDSYLEKGGELDNDSIKQLNSCRHAIHFLDKIFHPQQDMSLILETNQAFIFDDHGNYGSQEYAQATYSAVLDKQIQGICKLGNKGLLPLEEIGQLLNLEEEKLYLEKERFMESLLHLSKTKVLTSEEIQNLSYHVDTLGVLSLKDRIDVIKKKRADVFKNGFMEMHILSHDIEKKCTSVKN